MFKIHPAQVFIISLCITIILLLISILYILVDTRGHVLTLETKIEQGRVAVNDISTVLNSWEIEK